MALRPLVCQGLLILEASRSYHITLCRNPLEFEPTIAASERPETHAVDRAATAIGNVRILTKNLTSEKFQRTAINTLLYVGQT